MRPFPAPILMYHHVEPHPLTPPVRFEGSYLSPRTLADHFDLLEAGGRRGTALGPALELWLEGRLGRETVVLTFDDACSCFLRHGLPEIRKRGWSATVFAVAGELGGSNRWDHGAGERRETLMNAAELRGLADAGIEVGCHGATHADLTLCPADRLEPEVRESKDDLEEALGRPVTTFCYPYGHVDERSSRAVRQAGYRGAVSVWGWPGVSRRDRFALPRVWVGPGLEGARFRRAAGRLYPLWRLLPGGRR